MALFRSSLQSFSESGNLAFEEASGGSKVGVATIVAAGLLIWWRYPQWLLVATLLQAAVSIYVLICLKVHAV